MTVTFEVARSRSHYWPYFLRRAKLLGRHRTTVEDGVEIHWVEVEGIEAAVEIWQCTRSWKGVTYTIDGRAVPAVRFARIMYDAVFRGERTADMLNQVIAKKARERDERRGRE